MLYSQRTTDNRPLTNPLARIFHELLSRDREDGLATGQPQGADTRGRQEGWPYPWSQQVIHEIYGLNLHHDPFWVFDEFFDTHQKSHCLAPVHNAVIVR